VIGWPDRQPTCDEVLEEGWIYPDRCGELAAYCCAPTTPPPTGGDFVLAPFNTSKCPSGSESITTPGDCETAAADAEAPFWKSTTSKKRPEGCYRIKAGKRQGQYVFNDPKKVHPGAPHPSAGLVCKAGGGGPTPEPGMYFEATAGAACPADSPSVLSEAECRDYSEQTSKGFNVENKAKWPRGCFKFTKSPDKFRFNAHPTGKKPKKSMVMICKRSTMLVSVHKHEHKVRKMQVEVSSSGKPLFVGQTKFANYVRIQGGH
jgi:ribosomal protein L31